MQDLGQAGRWYCTHLDVKCVLCLWTTEITDRNGCLSLGQHQNRAEAPEELKLHSSLFLPTIR